MIQDHRENPLVVTQLNGTPNPAIQIRNAPGFTFHPSRSRRVGETRPANRGAVAVGPHRPLVETTADIVDSDQGVAALV